MSNESILDKYQDDIEKGDRIHITFAKMYGEMFDIPTSQSIFSMFNKICALYPKKYVLLALLDMYDMPNVRHETIYNLIVFLIKKRMESKICIEPEVDLNEQAKKLYSEYGRVL